MRARLADVTKFHGSQVVLEHAELEIGSRARIGLVGPNGIGKSTVLRLLAGEETPDTGKVSIDPPDVVVAHLAQQPELRAGKTLAERLAHLTGVAAAERELEAAAAALAEAGETSRGDSTRASAERYDIALARFLAVGGGDFEARAGAMCVASSASGCGSIGAVKGSRVARRHGSRSPRSCSSRPIYALLDEPTNDLDEDGLARLEAFVDAFPGALVVVSHDRAFLDRVADRIAEIDPRSHRITSWAGGWTEYARRRDEERSRAYAVLELAQARRRELAALLSERRTQARAGGAGLGEQSGGSDRRGTHALSTKVRQAERLLARNPLPEKPFESWELRLELRAGGRLPSPCLALAGAVVERGAFRLGPVDLELHPGERLAITGANGSGKTTLVRAVTGELGLAAGRRHLGRGVVVGLIGQQRSAYASDVRLSDEFVARTGLAAVDARTLLAKFGLGESRTRRAGETLSPGERTRAHLAELQARRVNLIVLDEPTNHLDLEAVEQLEQALSGWDGALVVISHDRRFLEAIVPTRALRLDNGRVAASRDVR